MKKLYQIYMLAVFTGFIAVFALLRVFLPAREFSQQENRYLQQRPAFSFSSLFSGEYTERFETFCTDQFPFRDQWTTLKARCELLSGKQENNGVYYGRDGVLIPAFSEPDPAFFAENVSFVRALTENVETPVLFGLIPGAGEVQRDLLPKNAPLADQQRLIEDAYSSCGAQTVDMLGALADHSGEYIFYRTDHHWTSLGAFYGYNALRSALGLPPAALGDYQRTKVTDAFYGTSYSSSGFSWVPPDEIETFVSDAGGALITNYRSGEAAETPLYDESFLAVKDKYSYFLGGNTPRLTVETGHADEPRICVIRDSYADSLLPFLLTDFSRIDMLDLRYYKGSVADYIREGDFDLVLVLYSVDNFCTDGNLFLLSM